MASSDRRRVRPLPSGDGEISLENQACASLTSEAGVIPKDGAMLSMAPALTVRRSAFDVLRSRDDHAVTDAPGACPRRAATASQSTSCSRNAAR